MLSQDFINRILNEQFPLNGGHGGWLPATDDAGAPTGGYYHIYTGEFSPHDPATAQRQQRAQLQSRLQQLSSDLSGMGGNLGQISQHIAQHYPDLQAIGVNSIDNGIAQDFARQGLISPQELQSFVSHEHSRSSGGGPFGFVDRIVNELNEIAPNEITQAAASSGQSWLNNDLGYQLAQEIGASGNPIEQDVTTGMQGIVDNLAAGNQVDPAGVGSAWFGTTSEAQPIDYLGLAGPVNQEDADELAAARMGGRVAASLGLAAAAGNNPFASSGANPNAGYGTADPVTSYDASQGTQLYQSQPYVAPDGGYYPGVEGPQYQGIDVTADAMNNTGAFDQYGSMSPDGTSVFNPSGTSLWQNPLVQGTAASVAADQISQNLGGNSQGGSGNNTNGGQNLFDLLNRGSGDSSLANLLGGLGSTALGVYSADKMADAYKDIAGKEDARIREMMGFGAPSRARFEASFRPDFDIMSIPGLKPAMDTSTQTLMRQLSTKGNPFGQPGGLAEALKYVTGSVALPAVQNYQAMNAGAGGLTQFAGGAAQGPNLNPSMAAINAQGQGANAIGYGLQRMTQRPRTMADLLQGLT
jgi:hypothetical protein